MNKTLIIMLDGFRKDYFNNDNTPFLSSLIKKYYLFPLNIPIGYKSTVGFFTGFKPSNLGLFTNYGYDPKHKYSKLFYFLLKLPCPINFYTINLLRHFKGEDFFFPSFGEYG